MLYAVIDTRSRLRYHWVSKMTASPTPPTRIMFVVPPAEGGIAEHVLSLLRGLDRERFRLSLVCSRGGRLYEDAQDLGLPVYPLSFSTRFNMPRLDRTIRLARLLVKEQPHIVHTHSWQAWLLVYFAALLSRRRAPLVCTIHGYPQRGLSGRSLAARLAASAARIICVSRSLCRLFAEANAAKIRIIPNGIDTACSHLSKEEARQRLGLSQEIPLVGCVARLAPQKGVGVLVEAAALLEGVHFAVIGDGPLRDKLQAASARLRLGPRFHFLGQISGARELLQAFDMIAIPSLSEGSSIIAMEAMAAARPVVASRLGPLEEIVADGETGLLVPPADPEALSRGLALLLHQPALAQKMGQAGRLRVEREFTIQQMVQQTAALYEEVLETKP